MINQKFDHLKANLLRINSTSSCFKPHISSLSNGKSNYKDWLNKMLPNTRLIIEPKIKGFTITIDYEGGILKETFTRQEADKLQLIRKIKTLPRRLPTKINIRLRGQLYVASTFNRAESQLPETGQTDKKCPENGLLAFCAFHIVNTDLNHFTQLLELKRLGFEIPDNEFTHFTREVELYIKCWREGKLFNKYPNDGIILKVNSRKLQKQLGENNLNIKWAHAIQI